MVFSKYHTISANTFYNMSMCVLKREIVKSLVSEKNKIFKLRTSGKRFDCIVYDNKVSPSLDLCKSFTFLNLKVVSTIIDRRRSYQWFFCEYTGCSTTDTVLLIRLDFQKFSLNKCKQINQKISNNYRIGEGKDRI